MIESPARHPVAAFQGPVTCRRDQGARAGLTLTGAAADNPAETLILTFLGPAPEDLPQTLEAPSVTRLSGQCYCIASPARQWRLQASAVYAHRDVGAAFYEAVPPRRVPLVKRVFWWSVLALAKRRLGRRLLMALRAR